MVLKLRISNEKMQPKKYKAKLKKSEIILKLIISENKHLPGVSCRCQAQAWMDLDCPSVMSSNKKDHEHKLTCIRFHIKLIYHFLFHDHEVKFHFVENTFGDRPHLPFL